MRVLVTRPQPGAGRTAARLAEMGHEPVLLPLAATRALPVAEDTLPVKIDAVAVTSASALRHLPPLLAKRLSTLPLHAVGGATAEAARAAGFARVVEGPGGAAGLAAAMAASAHGGETVLYLCGRVRLPEFERRLAEAGFGVMALETYDTVETEPSPEAIAAAIGPRPIDAVLLHSAGTATTLTKIMPALEARLAPEPLVVCLSPRIAAALSRNFHGKVRVAAQPDEDALLAELQPELR